MKLSYVVVLALVGLAVFFGYRALSQAGEDAGEQATTIARIPDSARRAQAETELRTAGLALEAYRTQRGTYAGASTAVLRALDAGVSPTLQVVDATDSDYCAAVTVDGVVYSKRGPTAPVVQQPCS